MVVVQYPFLLNRGSTVVNEAEHISQSYRVHVLITRDEDDTYSAVALNLPGAGSCGSSEEEAMENFQEAIRGVLESYADGDGTIPWQESVSEDIPFGAKHKWIIVDA